MENDFWIKKINAKEGVEFHKKEINAIILYEIKGEDIDTTSDSDNDEDELVRSKNLWSRYRHSTGLYVCVWLVSTLTSTSPIGSLIICMWSPARP